MRGKGRESGRGNKPEEREIKTLTDRETDEHTDKNRPTTNTHTGRNYEWVMMGTNVCVCGGGSIWVVSISRLE